MMGFGNHANPVSRAAATRRHAAPIASKRFEVTPITGGAHHHRRRGLRLAF
jgi:hypothetical protein